MDQDHKIIVFRKISPYLDLGEISIITQLNKYFYMHFMNSEVKFNAGFVLLSKFFLGMLTQENYAAFLSSQTGISISKVSDAFDICRNASNLLKNPYGELGFTSWEVEDGGS